MESSLLTQIPFSLAGSKSNAAEGSIVDNSSRHYTVSNGYCVPCYARNLDEPIDRRHEELAIDRKVKFFQLAEESIEVLWSREQIDAQKALFDSSPAGKEREAHGALLASAIVNRMERLARVYLQKGSTIGTRIDLTPEQADAIARITPEDDTAALEEKLSAIKQEFSEYYMYLTFNPPLGNPDVLGSVRLHGLVPDNDGILLDLVREMGKAFNLGDKQAEKRTYENIVHKIGMAMEGIDQIHEQMQRLMRVQGVMPMLTHAVQQTDPEASYVNILNEFTALARARTGIKTEDQQNYAPIFSRMMMLEQTLYDAHKAMRMNAREKSNILAQQVRDQLDNAVKLMMRSAISRTPLNEHSPKAGGVEASPKEKRAASSIGMLQRQVSQIREYAQSLSAHRE